MTDTKNDKQMQAFMSRIERKEKYRFWIELAIWILLTAIAWSLSGEIFPGNTLQAGFNPVFRWLTRILTPLFPILSFLIFLDLPFAALGAALSDKFKGDKSIYSPSGYNFDGLSLKYSDHLLFQTARESKYLSEKVFKRGGTYLVFGILLAVTGLIVLLVSSAYIEDTELNGFSLIKLALMRVTPFLFIEALALYFLRQHKFMQSEFRHFESIKREREHNLILFELSENTNLPNARELMQLLKFTPYIEPKTPDVPIPDHRDLAKFLRSLARSISRQ